MKQIYDKHLATRIGVKEFNQFHRKAKRYGGASNLMRKLVYDFLTQETKKSSKENTHARTED